MFVRVLLVASALTLACCGSAAAQTPRPAAPQTASLDSDAPPGSPPHWLPRETWVMQHWLPYDEKRLYRLLGVTRGDVWRLLRDDTRSLAQLAERRGWSPERLAQALVAPWRKTVSDPARLALLEQRALRTLTQGHLAQHIFFHSLHQNALPNHAPDIFGTRTRTEWLALRRSELSPVQICRLNGVAAGHAAHAARARLRRTAAAGVSRQAIPAAQARRLLHRQLRQLPRWLQQTRYNGPPPLREPRPSPATASNYSNNASLSGNGRAVAFEGYDAALVRAKTKGEIAVLARLPGAAAPLATTSASGVPSSNYNPAISADGRWVAFESAQGNLNFAKRYGEMRVLVRDLALGRVLAVSHPKGRRVPGTAYNPAISGDGRFIAYESYEHPELGGGTDVVVRDMRSGRAARVRPPRGAAAASEPQLSADGRTLVFSALVRLRSRIFARDLRTGRQRVVSGPGEEAWDASLAAGGTAVAYTVGGAGGSRIVVRDLRTGDSALVPLPAGAASASDPSLSASGRRVAFMTGATSRTEVWLHDLVSGATALVSRADGAAGAPASGTSGHPSISGDGRRVAFTSDAWNLSPAKCNGARGVFVRDVRRSTTSLASVGDGENRYRGPTRGSSAGAGAFDLPLCSAA